jgi:hypothetical protein
MMPLLLYLHLLFQTSFSLASGLRSDSLKQWYSLLHVPNGASSESQVQDPNFFLYRLKPWSPEAELEATKNAILDDKTEFSENEHPVCRFPARVMYLIKNKYVQSEQVAKPSCPLLDIYKKTTRAKKVSYVFSSYFLGSPGSAFGHTFFRIHKEDHSLGNTSELLDRGIGYAATVGNVNGFTYVIKGIFGGFKGEFTNLPYYYKVREYNDFEARDIWDYELNLSDEEIEFLILHLWELGNTYFRYYFFTQNCAYHLLTSLEAAAPRLSLIEKSKPWMIPADSVKIIVNSPQLVTKIHYRPSLESRANYQYSLLNENQRRFFHSYLNLNQTLSPDNKESLTEEEQVQAIDALLDYFDSLNPSGDPNAHFKFKERRSQALKLRASLKSPKLVTSYPPPPEKEPHNSHGSTRLTVGLTRLNSDTYGDFGFRFAIHDLLDQAKGYPPFSELELGRFNLRFSSSKEIGLSQFRILGVQNFQPVTDLEKSLSWSLVFDINDPLLIQSYQPLTEGFIGYSSVWISHLLYLQIGGVSNFKEVNPQMRTGILLNSSFFFLRYHLELVSQPQGINRINFESRIQLLEYLDLGLNVNKQNEFSLRFLYFF